MQLNRFRVENVRSVADSGWVDVGPRLTILVGKNGSGKTAILETLGSVAGTQWNLPDSATPLWDPSAKPKLTLQYSLTKADIDKLGETANLTWSRSDRSALKSGVEVTVLRGAYGARSVDGKLNNAAFNKSDAKGRATARVAALQAFLSLRKLAGTAKSKTLLNTKSDWGEVFAAYREYEALLRARLPSSTDLQKALNAFRVAKDELYNAHHSMRFRDAASKLAPHFILLSAVDLPTDVEVSSSNVASSRFFSNLTKAADVTAASLPRMSSIARRNLSLSLSQRMTSLVREHWKQDSLEIRVDFSADAVGFVAIIGGSAYTFDQLSTGTAWFLDFLVHIAGLETSDQQSMMLLLDEPAQDLHPTAQREVARWLSMVSQRMPVVYSTHSPYLFSRGRLDEIRPVLKRDGRTQVENSLFCTNDADTLSPILDVIGLPVADADALSLTQQRNVIGEGPSDYHYLVAMQRILAFTPPVSVIPCVGATRTQHIASILHGWGIPYLIVVDADDEGRRIERAIKRFGAPAVIPVSNQTGDAIEDLFDESDFEKYVLHDLTFVRRPLESNSKLAGRLPGGKRALARRFAERADSGDMVLSANSIERFRALFESISARFPAA